MMAEVDELAMLVDTHDQGLGSHTEHVARLAEQVALSLGCMPERAREVFLAKLHDIGKVAIADAILRKPDRLAPEEWRLMRQHPAIGANVVAGVGGRLASPAPIIRSHHEHYDGSGYPAGLRAEEIPLESRVIGVADAYDAMISERPYPPSRSVEDRRAELRRGAATQFDPELVAAMDRDLDDEQRTREVFATAQTDVATRIPAVDEDYV